jgi:hypothetical protein
MQRDLHLFLLSEPVQDTGTYFLLIILIILIFLATNVIRKIIYGLWKNTENINSLTDEAQTALFQDPVRTAQ